MTASNPVYLCITIGYMAAKIGRYQLSQKNTVQLNTVLASEQSPNKQLPDSKTISKMSVENNNCALVVPPTQLPIEITTPFILAGESFAADLDKFCEAIIFTSHLFSTLNNHGTVRWEAGFEIGMAGVPTAAFPSTLRQSMFVNLRDLYGLEFPGTQMHWIMAFLLGRLKANGILESQQINPETVNEDIKNYFAYSYQLNITNKLIESLSTRHPSFCASEEGALFAHKQQELTGIIEDHSTLLSRFERNFIGSFQPN
jgi:hypothetical protein